MLNIKSGDKFGNFKVIKELPRGIQPSGAKYRRFECECVCGQVKVIRAAHLVRENSKPFFYYYR